MTCIHFTKRTSITHTSYLSKRLILLAFQKQNYYHRMKYISKSSSSKYNEVFHYYLYLRNFLCTETFHLAQQCGSSQCNINSMQQPKEPGREVGSVSSPSSIEFASSPPNQVAECGVCILTTSPSRGHKIQQIIALDPAPPTRPIIAAISFKQLFSRLTSESLQFNYFSKSKLQKLFWDLFWSPHYTSLTDTMRQWCSR